MKTGLANRRYGEVFRKRAWIIALAVVLTVAGGLSQLTGRVPQYQAETSLLVSPETFAPTTLGNAAPSFIQRAYRDTVTNDMIHLLQSRTISERAAQQVGGLRPEEIARGLTVKKIPGTDFLIIGAVHERPEQAALIANAVAQQTVAFSSEIHRVGATSARRFIEDQLGIARQRLAAAEQALFEFQSRTGAAALPGDMSRAEQRMLDLQAAYEAATLDETTARTRAAAIRSHLASQNDGQLASLSITTNPVVTQIRDHLMGLELQLADMRQMYTIQHPQVQVLLGRIAADRQRLNAEAAQVINDKSLGMSPAREQFLREMISGEVDAAAARARADGLGTLLSRLEAKLSNLPSSALSLARLRRDVSDTEQLVTRLTSLQQDVTIQEGEAVASAQSALVVVDPAIAPDRPIPAPLAQTAALGGLLGLCLGAALALAVDSAENRIRSFRRMRGSFTVPEPAGLRPMAARLGSLSLAAAAGRVVLQVPVLLVALVLGVAVVVGGVMYGAQVLALFARVAYVGPALTQMFHTVSSLYAAQVTSTASHIAQVSQAMMLTFSSGL